MVDAIAIGLAATKGLAKKVERVEHSLGLADAPRGMGLSADIGNGEGSLGLREAA